MQAELVDVLIVGAGISGISAAYYLQRECPTRSFAILEGRASIGGTWDLFRYPGVRSDSDMHTLGYSFRPWRDPQAIASGPAIMRYLHETAHEFGIDAMIRFEHRVVRASWSSAEARWLVDVERGPQRERIQMRCNFLFLCTGYYEYEQGYAPRWAGMEDFRGQIIHPQHWPADLDYAGKRVVVIGSGATAITLLPALTAQAGHVVMLQRSPSYVVALPSEDALAARIRRKLPAGLANRIIRWRSIALGMYFYQYTRRYPEKTRQMMLQGVQHYLGPHYDIATHFSPRYNPWDQRLCVAPDGDFFEAIRSGAASVVTDQIERFTETGIRLASGAELPADLIVTATGLRMELFGKIAIDLDGEPVEAHAHVVYRGAMLSNIPNLAFSIGYTNSSWTLRCELVSAYVCRVLNYMEQQGYTTCMPYRPGAAADDTPVIDLTSGYVQRALAVLPRQGATKPWKMYQNYVRDLFNLRWSRIADGTLQFGGAGHIRRQLHKGLAWE
ncbi:MAG TPA: NAD(P)/FAD-dependent oxidoreductase [Roseiflexaceae bacterium]|nr:NAD(P)/FAD-dependent oxidoreductase [Roseiflexaceae bacterium]